MPQVNKLNTQHFVFHYLHSREVKKMALGAERNYDRVVADLNHGRSLPVIEVFVHPDKRSFRATLGFNGLGAIRGVGEIHVVDIHPLMQWCISPGRLLIHEFTHCVTLHGLIENDISTGRVDNVAEWAEKYDSPKYGRFNDQYPKWLWESVACYEAGQFNFFSFHLTVLKGIPSLREMNGHGSKVYFLGYTLADFIIKKWGKTGLIDLLLQRGEIERALHIDPASFENEYRSFLKHHYYCKFFRLSSGVRSISLL